MRTEEEYLLLEKDNEILRLKLELAEKKRDIGGAFISPKPEWSRNRRAEAYSTPPGFIATNPWPYTFTSMCDQNQLS